MSSRRRSHSPDHDEPIRRRSPAALCRCEARLSATPPISRATRLAVQSRRAGERPGPRSRPAARPTGPAPPADRADRANRSGGPGPIGRGRRPSSHIMPRRGRGRAGAGAGASAEGGLEFNPSRAAHPAHRRRRRDRDAKGGGRDRRRLSWREAPSREPAPPRARLDTGRRSTEEGGTEAPGAGGRGDGPPSGPSRASRASSVRRPGRCARRRRWSRDRAGRSPGPRRSRCSSRRPSPRRASCAACR